MDGCVMWQAFLTNRKEGFFFCFCFFPFFLIFFFITSPFLPSGFDSFFGGGGRSWKKSTRVWFGEVVDDHVQQQVPVGPTEESLAQTTAV